MRPDQPGDELLLREAAMQAGHLNAALKKLHEAGIEIEMGFEKAEGTRPLMIMYLHRKGRPFG